MGRNIQGKAYDRACRWGQDAWSEGRTEPGKAGAVREIGSEGSRFC